MKLTVAGVSFAFAARSVLEGVTFAVGAGRLVGIIGPNGAGKSTLLRCMHAALPPSSGSVLVDGSDIAALRQRELALRIAVVPQSCNPGFEVSVVEFVRMGRYAREPFLGSPADDNPQAVSAAIEAVGVASLSGRSVHELSGGEFRRVLIAQALAQEAPVLLFDEPVQQLDIGNQLDVMELIRSVSRRTNAAGVAVLHDLALAARYCDEILLLSNGRIVGAGTPDAVITPDALREVYGIEAAVERCLLTDSLRITALRARPRQPAFTEGS